MNDAEKYDVSIGPSGKLGWDRVELSYQTTTAYVVEVLAGKASNAYKSLLFCLGISYAIPGYEKLDFGVLPDKLVDSLTPHAASS